MTALARILVSCCVAYMQLPAPGHDLHVMLAPATIAIDGVRRGVLVPFEVGDDLPDGTIIEYIAELMTDDRVLSQVTGRASASGGRVLRELKFGASPASPRVRLTARAPAVNRFGVAIATIHVPQQQRESCGGLVLEQAATRRGLREFSRSSSVTISTLVWAQGLDGTVAPLRFGLGAVGAEPQKFWPVQLGIPLRNGMWRVAFTLRAPLPAGKQEVRILRDERLLGAGCMAQFSTY